MNQNLIISENFPELINLFAGDEVYMIDEPKWYEEIRSEGGNKYRFLNIVSHDADEVIPAAQKDFFFRMANAIQTDRIKMDADGFAVINIADYKGVKWANIEKLFSPRYCIFWGVDPYKLDVPCHINSRAIYQECRVVAVDDMATIENDQALKRNLWVNIQAMFDFGKK
jgi:hypothetical protein